MSTIQELIEEAADMVADFKNETAGMPEGLTYDSTLASYEQDAWELVQRIAEIAT